MLCEICMLAEFRLMARDDVDPMTPYPVADFRDFSDF